MNSALVERIELNATERKIQHLLLEYAKERKTDEPTVLRITGGWVRDKLLGKESDDLDIALNNCTGVDFAEGLHKFIGENTTTFGISAHNVHKIEKNPEKSKHLETATTKLYGIDVDFVNLRSEEYAGDSRIPTIGFGSAEQDAYRRDATLNALFYNLNTDTVEDFTGKGIEDLRQGILRTPLEPFKTFDEDPLRVLRLLRFSARFNFTIDPEAEAAMGDERIKDALLRKVSRERVGIEITKALAAKYPENALLRIAQLGLEDTVFTADGLDRSTVPDPGELDAMVRSTRAVIDISDRLHPVLRAVLQGEKAQPGALWLCTALSRYAGATAKEKKRIVLGSSAIIKEGLKLGNEVAKRTSDVLGVRETVAAMALEATTSSRKEIGLLVRRCGSEWPLSILHALIKDFNTQGETVLERYDALVSRIEHEGLSQAWNMASLLDGRDIQIALGMQKGGPWLSKAKDMVIEYQLANPEATADECSDYIVSVKSTILGKP